LKCTLLYTKRIYILVQDNGMMPIDQYWFFWHNIKIVQKNSGPIKYILITFHRISINSALTQNICLL
jgi:hypothetical protein